MADIKAAQRRFVEEYQSTGDVSVAEDMLADDFVDHTPFGPIPGTKEGVLQLFAMLRGAFPDLHAEIHELIAEGDKVVTRKTFRGTHEGEFMGIPPSGKKVAWDVIDIVQYKDDKMAAHWNVVDALSLIQQLGAIPS